VCELFGCTGWARKFRFAVLDADGTPKTTQIKKGETFRFRFTELRPLRVEEWALLDLTLRFIAAYGAIGGKTVYKPTDETSRQNQPHHKDYGLLTISGEPPIERKRLDELKGYVARNDWRKLDDGKFSWASLSNFWCVQGRYLARQNPNQSSFNKVVGRRMEKKLGQQLDQKNKDTKQWLAGGKQESKKVFSFKELPRTFGFVKPGEVDFDEMRRRLQSVWQEFQDTEFRTGNDILQELLSQQQEVSP
ncbi:MAG: RAMP superfamily CRISPR-associated protein, partial [Gemmataceae bacterium]